MSDENQYNYTYSPKDQAEVKQIQEKYCPKADDKMFSVATSLYSY